MYSKDGVFEKVLVSSIKYTGLFEMIVGISTTCHTQYTLDSSVGAPGRVLAL